ncbi:MAG: nucleotidyl transferase AbiEii/AbiGii toxin family protein, partial [Alkalispirochaeta sp.]
MKEQLHALVETGKTVNESTLRVREYLQARILEALQRAGAFRYWAFLGGTALRVLFRLPRFSEDLEFSLA